jgi:hypothetical protein
MGCRHRLRTATAEKNLKRKRRRKTMKKSATALTLLSVALVVGAGASTRAEKLGHHGPYVIGAIIEAPHGKQLNREIRECRLKVRDFANIAGVRNGERIAALRDTSKAALAAAKGHYEKEGYAASARREGRNKDVRELARNRQADLFERASDEKRAEFEAREHRETLKDSSPKPEIRV